MNLNEFGKIRCFLAAYPFFPPPTRCVLDSNTRPTPLSSRPASWPSPPSPLPRRRAPGVLLGDPVLHLPPAVPRPHRIFHRRHLHQRQARPRLPRKPRYFRTLHQTDYFFGIIRLQ